MITERDKGGEGDMITERDKVFVMRHMTTGAYDLDTISHQKNKCLMRWKNLPEDASPEDIAVVERQEFGSMHWSIVQVRLIEV